MKATNILKRMYLALIFLILYAPIFTLIVLSFNQSKSRAKWGGFTFHWYISLFQNKEIMDALWLTLLLAFLSALLATIMGTAACIGIQRMKKGTQSVIMGITNIPMLNAEIVTGISLMLAFIAMKMEMGFFTVLIGHITFNLPYVILSVMPKVKQASKASYEAALDLGATPIHAFYKIILPDILPGILSGFLLSFTMSLDDFIITYFTKGRGINTLSTKIYAELKKGIMPEMYALSAIMFLSVLVLLILVNRLPKNKEA